LVRRVDCRYASKHRNWPNIVENEVSSLARQCAARRRFSHVRSLRAETTAWSSDVNSSESNGDSQMKVAGARCELKSVCPKIKLRESTIERISQKKRSAATNI
jgi:hypothetical protein